MIITTKTLGLVLKPVSAENSVELSIIFANPEVNKWAPNIRGNDAKTIERKLHEYFSPKGLDYYAAIYCEDTVVGFVSLEKDNSDGFYYIDVYIDPKHQKKGIASEAITDGLMQYAQNTAIKKVAANIDSDNTKSLNMYKKLTKETDNLGIELKFVSGLFGALWNSKTVRYVASVGICYLWEKYQRHFSSDNYTFSNPEDKDKIKLEL